MKHLIFEATPDGNALYTMDGTIKAVVSVPDGASEDYGYLTMKRAILAAYHGTEPLTFPYDTFGQEQYLEADASADVSVSLDIEQTEAKGISINNGRTYTTPAEALERMPWDVIVNAMDDETREAVHYELAPCTNLEFLTRYLEIAPEDLVIG